MTETRPAVAPPVAAGAPAPVPAPGGLAGWLTTADHKRTGRAWLVTSLAFLVVGGVLGVVLNVERVDTGLQVVGDDVFDQIYTLHGMVAVFLFLVPLALGLATYLVPLQVGASSIAFPRAAATAYWCYLVCGGLLLAAYVANGGPGGGSDVGVDLWILSLIGLNGATVLALVSILTTVLALRAPGMTLDRAPLFSWSMLVGGGLTLLAAPVLMANLVLVWFAHHFGDALTGDLGPVGWFFSLPQVYVLAVPAVGVIAEIVPVFARVRPRRHGVMMILVSALGIFGFGAWAQAPVAYDDLLYVAVGLVAVVPVLALVAGWADTLRRGTVRMSAALALALVSAVLLTMGVVAGAAAVIEPLELAGTTWMTGQVHLTLFGGATVGLLAGVFYWAPKIWGVTLGEVSGQATAAALFLAALLLALPDLVNGAVGNVALRSPTFDADGLTQTMNVVSAVGGVLAAVAVLSMLGNLCNSVVRSRGRLAGDDPWQGHTLEWATSSPPGPANFDGPLPMVRSAAPLLDARDADDGTDAAGEAR